MTEKPDYCKACPLYEAAGIVWGEGPSNARMMLVGEAPGEEEAATLRPFVGGSGRVLSALLAHARIRRSDVYVTNVVKCRPTAVSADGRRVNRAPTETEIRHCARFLHAELSKIDPNTIVALGNVPLRTLTGTRNGIMVMRSVPIEGPRRLDADAPPFKVVPTLHPAFVMRAQDLWPAVVYDLMRAARESATRVIVRHQWQHRIHAPLMDVRERLLQRIRERGMYIHDLETTGLDPTTDAIRCIGLAADPDEVYVFDWTLDVQQFVASLHADPTLCVVGQNSEGFDIPFQEAKGMTFAGPSYDTMIGFHLLNSALPKDLAFIGATYTDEPYWKDASMYRAGEDALQVGCAKDVHATARAYIEQHKELEAYGQLDLYYKHIMPLQPVLRAMTRRGIRKDQQRAAAWHVVLQRKATELEERLRRGLGDASLDVNSPKQLMDLLYRRMGLPVQYAKDDEGVYRPTVDADALDRLAVLTNNPILRLIRSIRTLRKWDATYVLCPQDEQGFVHPKFGCAKAATGRLNSWEPNAQNWPSEVRELLVPDSPDHVLLSCDWNQIEWRLAMVLSGDEAGLQALVAGRDVHRDAYAQAFGKEYAAVTRLERYEAKFINYGLMYGRGADSIAAGRAGNPDSAIPLERVTAYIDAFFQKFSGFARFRKHLEEFVVKHHYYATAWGRRRWWYTRQMPEVYNFPMQGNAAHMMYEALVQLERELPPGATLRLTVHDEVVINVPKEQQTLLQTIKCVTSVMQQPFPRIVEASLRPDVVKKYYPNGWFCPADWHIGEHWRATKPETPEEEEAERALRRRLGVEAL